MLRRVRTTLLVCLTVGTGLALGVPAQAQEPPPAPVGLTDGWSYRPDRSDVGMERGWPAVTPREGWQAVAVPHLFSREAIESDFGGTVGWYRLRFTAPAARPDVDWALRFEQVRRSARVWLNGRALGRHADPYVPFSLPAVGLRAGAANELLVRVDSRKEKEPREGWWNWGGIVRPVSLVPEGRLALRDPGVLSEVDCPKGGEGCTAAVVVDGMLENRGTTPIAAGRVALRLEAPEGGGVITGSAKARTLMPGEATRVRFTTPVEDPALWSPERPRRYAATLTTSVGDGVTQVDRRAVGLRAVRVRDGLLELNGRQLSLRGAAIQEDLQGRGPALSDADIAGIVRELQAVGANVTRAHYLLNPKLLDALDEAGIMVWSQAPIYHRDRLLETPEQRAAALETVRRTVLEARSHPSVITHSVANELSAKPDASPGTSAFLARAYDLTRELDPTLPVSVDMLSYPGFPTATAYQRYDLLGINSYFGWYPGKKKHSTANIADLGPFLDRMRRQYPTQGLVLTEFGAESTFEGPARTKETFAFQAEYVEQVLQTVRDRPFVGGAIYWTLREFAVKPDWDGGAKRSVPRDGIHNKGLVTYGGRRKPAFAVAERDFAATPTFRTVEAAAARGLPTGRGGGGGDALMAFVVLAVGGLLVFDVWAVAGILRARREPLPAEG